MKHETMEQIVEMLKKGKMQLLPGRWAKDANCGIRICDYTADETESDGKLRLSFMSMTHYKLQGNLRVQSGTSTNVRVTIKNINKNGEYGATITVWEKNFKGEGSNIRERVSAFKRKLNEWASKTCGINTPFFVS